VSSCEPVSGNAPVCTAAPNYIWAGRFFSSLEAKLGTSANHTAVGAAPGMGSPQLHEATPTLTALEADRPFSFGNIPTVHLLDG